MLEFLESSKYESVWVCGPRSLVANVLDNDIIVSEFEPQLYYCVHFRTNTLVKVMKLLISPGMDWIVLLMFFDRGSLIIN